jgi:hypothetical protein
MVLINNNDNILGVHSIVQSMGNQNVFTHIIGKIIAVKYRLLSIVMKVVLFGAM